MADEAAERTEQPTPRRRQQAVEQGNVPRSVDLTAAIALLGGLLLLNIFGHTMFTRMLQLTQELGRVSDPTLDGLPVWLARAGRAAMEMVLPFMVLLLVVTVVGSLVQTGLVLTWKRLTPKLEAIDPIRGFRKLFSIDPVQRLGMGILKIAVLIAVAWFTLAPLVTPIVGAAAVEPAGIVHMGSQLVFRLALRLALALLILGLIDYLLQRWKVEKSLKMSKQEIRDEMKNMDGDPLVRQRRRQAQARLAMQRMGIDVPKADVVVTNPTEYAVAIRYDEASMTAPRVIAKGKDLLALRIRQIAEQHGVPIVQRPPLARALYASVEVGQEIPPQFYRAVAELLAYVYQLSRRAAS